MGSFTPKVLANAPVIILPVDGKTSLILSSSNGSIEKYEKGYYVSLGDNAPGGTEVRDGASLRDIPHGHSSFVIPSNSLTSMIPIHV